MTLDPTILLVCIVLYLLILVFIARYTGKNSNNSNFFLGERKAPWVVIAFGMIGSSLSGVTFLSIPGVVGKEAGANMSFSYMQLILGNWIGYIIVALVLLPLYYRMNLTSIYGYLRERLGWGSYKTGAAFFLVSRMLGSSLRLFIVCFILHKFVLSTIGVPFWVTAGVSILLIWAYTNKGGIGTIIWTDIFQTVFMLMAVGMTLYGIMSILELSPSEFVNAASREGYSKLFFFEGGWGDPNNFFKQFLTGILITIVMTGLDQDMMQKNLACKNIADAKKNMLSFATVFVLVNLVFLFLGAAMYLYVKRMGIDIADNRDELFANLALHYFSPTLAVIFILGLISAAYSSADSALTAMTTSVCVDFLGFERKQEPDEKKSKKTRITVHIILSIVSFLVILLFYALNSDSVINTLFRIAGYTYGPLLGLFAFGILTKRELKDKWAPLVCLISPVISAIIDMNSRSWFGGLELGFLTLALNGFLTFVGLYLLSGPQRKPSIDLGITDVVEL